MDKSILEAMSLDMEKLKILEPDFAEDIDAVMHDITCGNLAKTFEWVVTRLYLTASLKGFMLGKSEQAKKDSMLIDKMTGAMFVDSPAEKVVEVPTE